MNSPARGIAILLLALTFAVGSMTGMALEEALGIDWFDFLDEDENSVEQVLLNGFSLTAEQDEMIKDILDRRQDRLEAYWHARLPDIHEIVAGSRAEIRSILTPSQREDFDRRVNRLGPIDKINDPD
ncbi:MAG TPA: hypothetical protein VFI91_13520 [Longimicrobiaceae bacterium]|nr:hypothetical protein [Longimicrobiaceae bacterium]